MRLTLAMMVLAVAPGAPLLAQPGAAPAQDNEGGSANPAGAMLKMEFAETETVPGQPLDLRLTVLVETYMLEPPVWPGLEAPNVLVRLPARSTNPTSEGVGGATWSGVTRRYAITPMIPGRYALPPQEVVVTYADPETNAPVRTSLVTGPISFAGIVPEGAEGLDPFLAGTKLTLEQKIDGEPEAMKPGDSVTRTVTARLLGTPSMFIPGLLTPAAIPGVAAYPAEPLTTDTEDRGTVTGVRTESVTYVAEGGGHGDVPPVSIGWYDLGAGKVETATVEGFEMAVDGPPAVSGEPRDWRRLAATAVAAIAAVIIVLLTAGRANRVIRRRVRRWCAARLASEGHAWRYLQTAISRQDIAALYLALDRWAERFDGADPRRDADVEGALVRIGVARYGGGARPDTDGWRALSQALTSARRETGRDRGRSALPPLNFGEGRYR